MKLFYSLLFIALLSANSVFAQRGSEDKAAAQERYKAKADKEFEALRYSSAAALYKMADTAKQQVISNLASSYYFLKDYDNAEKWFAKAIAGSKGQDDLYLKYAEVLANKAKYKEAEKWYAEYHSLHRSDRRAANLSKLTKALDHIYKDSLHWEIDYLSVNTARDEFSPSYFKRGLLFSSNRDKKWGISNIFGWNQTPFTDLYLIGDTANIHYMSPKNYFYDYRAIDLESSDAKKQRLPLSVNDTKVLGDISLPRTISDVGGWKDPSGAKLIRGNLNTRFHDGPLSLDASQSYMIYNRNHKTKSSAEERRNGIYKLNLYEVNYTGGTWHNKKPFPFNEVDYSTAHPALSSDGRVLYFVSDMPGGSGGKDIYYSTRESAGSEWSAPLNLGERVNTEGDESFPYLSPDGQLYFSSNGHAGLGGLDIFVVELKDNRPAGTVKNIGFPLNSTKDDFGIVMEPGQASGYFSSNRFGSDDIFRFRNKPLIIDLKGQVLVKYLSGQKVVAHAEVQVVYNGITDTLYTDRMGHFSKVLDANTNYKITTFKSGYGKADTALSTKGINQTQTIQVELVLSEPYLTDCELKNIFGLENIYYDLDKSSIRKDASLTLDRIAALMREYPSVSVVAASHCDSRASHAYNMALSLRRSEAAKKYLVDKGIDASRIETTWFGESRLTNGCADGAECDEEEQQLNRRTEFQIVRDGRNISKSGCEE